jgi:hypothetical protein
VVVNDISLFISHDHSSVSDKTSKITSKTDRLAKVQHLRLAGLGPSTAWRVTDILQDGDWSLINETLQANTSG